MRMKIEDKRLESYLKSDIRMLGLPTDFKLDFRGYSKKYYGRYYVSEKRIVVYILNQYGDKIPYEEILDTVLHEAIHHYQHHHQKGFVRVKGVMHDMNFKRIYERNLAILKDWEVIPCA